MCNSPDVPLQDEQLTVTIELRTSLPSILARMGILIQVGHITLCTANDQHSRSSSFIEFYYAAECAAAGELLAYRMRRAYVLCHHTDLHTSHT